MALAGLALGASAAAGPRDPRERHTKAGEAIARKAVLRRSDFRRGWRQTYHRPRRARCRAYNPNFSRLTRIGRARSEFSFGRRAYVISAVSVYLAPGQAATVFETAARSAFLTCVRAEFVKAFARIGVRARQVAKRTLVGPRLGSPARRFRLTLEVTSRGRAFRFDYDTVLFQVDRAIAQVSYQGYGEPERIVEGAARTVASRL